VTTVNRAVVWHGPEDVRLEDRALPERPRAGWVRVAVAWCGVCGSDTTEVLRGPMVLPVEPHPRLGTSVPLVLGHEIAGEVVAVGDGVDGLRAGDPVVSDSLDGCGACARCDAGDANLCTGLAAAGLHFDGGLAR